MVRRLSALALATVIVGAPVSAAVCQVCTARDRVWVATAMVMPTALRMAGHIHHRASPSPPPTDGVRMTLAPQICGHPLEETVVLQQTQQVLAAPALLSADAFTLVGPIDRVLFTHTDTVQHSPPGALVLITQLRV